jgi:hypothetical protein
MDGGDCELVDVDGNTIYVNMIGACSGCGMASMTIGGIQQRMMEDARRIHPRRARLTSCLASGGDVAHEADIYLDNNATTACDRGSSEAMLPYFLEQFGNASSIHSFGNGVGRGLGKDAQADTGADRRGTRLRDHLHLLRHRIRFSTAILSAIECFPRSATNHHHHGRASRRYWRCATQLEKEGYVPFTGCAVDSRRPSRPRRNTSRLFDAQAWRSCPSCGPTTRPAPCFPSWKWRNMAHAAGVQFHTDAVQAVGKIPINLAASKIDMLSHLRPQTARAKGIGVLYLRHNGGPLPAALAWRPPGARSPRRHRECRFVAGLGIGQRNGHGPYRVRESGGQGPA